MKRSMSEAETKAEALELTRQFTFDELAIEFVKMRTVYWRLRDGIAAEVDASEADLIAMGS